MSANWQVLRIGDVAVVYDGPHATPPLADEGPVYLGIGNITADGHLDLSDVRHIAEKDFSRWTKRVTPRAGDIVFTYEATLNRYAIIPKGFRGCLGRRTALIRTNPGAVDTRFLFYSFFGREWRDTIEANRLSGATVDRIPIAKFPDFPIRLPPMTTQRRIASILGAYDDLIEVNRRRIAILEEMARRIYEEWFVRDTDGRPVKRLDELIEVDPTTRVPPEGLKPFVPMTSVSNSSMVITDIERRDGNSGSKFRIGDTLLARITPCLENGKTGFVDFLTESEPVGFGSTEFIVMRGRVVPPEFVQMLARSEPFRAHAIASMSGATGRQRVRRESIEQYVVPMPPVDRLEGFAKAVRPMFQMTRTLSDQNTHLAAQRDLLLPKLISGEIDVSDPSAIAEAAE